VGRWFLAVLCAASVAFLGTGRASAFATTDNVPLQMDDGVVLEATLYTPSGPPPAKGFPAIVLFHGLGSKRQSLDFIARRWADKYVVLAFDARGHGQSGGLTSIDGPRETADTRDVFDWLASNTATPAHPLVDSKHIGAWGISLGGGAVLRSLGEGVPWGAAEVVQTWTNLYGALFPQNLSKSGAIYNFLNAVPQDKLDPSVLAIKEDALASKHLPALKQFGRVRSSSALLAKVRTPVYFFQGRRDFAFDIAQAVNGYRLVKGPKRLYIGDFGHSPSKFPGPDIKQVLAEGTRWFSRYLLGISAAPTKFPLSLAPDPWRGKARAFRGTPPTALLRIRFPGGNTLTGIAKSQRTVRRLPTRVETFGSPVVRVRAKLSGGWSRLVAVLTAKTPRGKVIVVSEGGVSTAGKGGTRALTIRLLDDATLIPRGSKLTLTLASSSMAQNPGNLLYLDLPMPSAAKITLGPAQLSLPVLRAPVSR
jgi:predicted acyl esterase